MNAFIHTGDTAYRAVIRAEYESEKRKLKELLRHAETLHEQNQIAEELRNLKIKYQAIIARLGSSLF